MVLLLDLPNELFTPILRTLIDSVGVLKALQYREVCSKDQSPLAL
jgi:hypothetical protein